MSVRSLLSAFLPARRSALFRRFFVTAAINTSFVALLAVWIAVTSIDRIELQHEQRQFRGLAKSVLDQLAASNYELTALTDEFERMRRVLPGLELYVLDEHGTIQFSLGSQNAAYGGTLDLRPIKRYLSSGDEALPISFESPSVRGVQAVFSAARFEYLGHEQFLLIVPESTARTFSLRNLRENYGLLATLLLVPVLAILATMTAAVTLRFLAKRFATLVEGVERFAKGDLATRISDPSPDEIGKLAEAFNVMADALAQNLDQLAKRDAVRRELIADISHDLRRPLQLLRLSVDGILSSRERGAPLEEYLLHPLSGNLDGLQRLLDELFELAKLEGRDAELELVPIDLGDFIVEVLDRFQPLARARGIELGSEGAGIDARVLAQPELLERALGNLIENATRHTASGGSVTVRLVTDRTHATISVADTGHGIPPEERDRLFERFAQGASQPRSHTGCGLGLAIVRKIVEAHHSTVTVESKLGEGTIFSFRIALRAAVLFLPFFILWHPGRSEAQPGSAVRVTVYRADDPIELQFSDIDCPQLEGHELHGSADTDGDGSDEAFAKGRDGVWSRWDLSRSPCREMGRITPQDPALDTFAGAADFDHDGREEVYFVAPQYQMLIGVRVVGTELRAEAPFLLPPLPGPPRNGPILTLGAPTLVVPSAQQYFWIPIRQPMPISWRIGLSPAVDGVIVGSLASDSVDSLLIADFQNFGLVSRVDLKTSLLLDASWAEFPFSSLIHGRAGDFDGDGETDLLAELPGLLGFWMRTSTPEGQLEFPLTSRRRPSLDGSVVGDFDGDGAEEILLAPITGKVTLAKLPGLAPFPDVTVRVDGELKGVTDRDGALELSPAEPVMNIEVSSVSNSGLARSRNVIPGTRRVRFVLRDPHLARSDASAIGNTASASGPRLCLGYEQSGPQRARRYSGPSRFCPPHYAILSLDDGNQEDSARRMECCRLPADDILLPEHSFVTDRCAESEVATGFELSPDSAKLTHLRCTKINAKRYALSSPAPGSYWGIGSSQRSFRLAKPWHELPLGIRYAVGRLQAGAWDADGCIGSPPGALFIGGFSADCKRSQFRELLEKQGDRVVPVKIIPDCAIINNLLDPRSGCVLDPESPVNGPGVPAR